MRIAKQPQVIQTIFWTISIAAMSAGIILLTTLMLPH